MGRYVAGRFRGGKAGFFLPSPLVGEGKGASRREYLNLPQLRNRLAGALERVAGLAGVGQHVALEGLDRCELLLVANPAEEGDVERLPVQVAVEVEQEHLKQRRAIVERRPPAEIRDAVITHVAD